MVRNGKCLAYRHTEAGGELDIAIIIVVKLCENVARLLDKIVSLYMNIRGLGRHEPVY